MTPNIPRPVSRSKLSLASSDPSEIFPGLNVTSNEEISYLARKASNTVYHSSGTCKMGPSTDEMAVVDKRYGSKD
ncbi:hypothetical protein K439DRAFT_1643230 [Ramaria rubella]|nr:hypothetical protein K439DRAFT_1643230 [Ramaria rubella]